MHFATQNMMIFMAARSADPYNTCKASYKLFQGRRGKKGFEWSKIFGPKKFFSRSLIF
jgi:hypothetical protein